MNFVRLLSENDERYKEAMHLYKASFPVHEQREEGSQRAILHHPNYHFNLIFDNDLFVGTILYWENHDFIYIEHFCIKSEMRNKAYGRRTLELLNAEADIKAKTIILEIDPPVDEVSIRRKGFYERAQYKENPFKHIHPPYHKENKGHDLVVMSYPRVLSEVNYEDFSLYLRNTVMAQ